MADHTRRPLPSWVLYPVCGGADNTTLNAGAGGDVYASDDIGGVKFQRVKLIEGADGTNDGDISAANPLPVTVTSGTAPSAPLTVNGSAAGTSVIVSPGGSNRLYIQKGSLHNRAAAENVVSLRDGAAGTIRFTANLAADGGGTMFDFGLRGWQLTAATALVADIGAASVDVNITEYYIAT